MFIRVRNAVPGTARHEYDIPIAHYERHKDRYKVVDRKPVAKQRPASFIPGVVGSKASAKVAVTNGEEIAPSAGLVPEEEN